MERYLTQREALINEDRRMRVDYRVHHASDDIRKRAETVVAQIEAAEGKAIWERDHEGIEHVFPGMEFLTSKYILSKYSYIILTMT
jgi:adenosine deaminase CECR1